MKRKGWITDLMKVARGNLTVKWHFICVLNSEHHSIDAEIKQFHYKKWRKRSDVQMCLRMQNRFKYLTWGRCCQESYLKLKRIRNVSKTVWSDFHNRHGLCVWRVSQRIRPLIDPFHLTGHLVRYKCKAMNKK